MLNYIFTDIETHRVKEWNEISDEQRLAWEKYYHIPDSYNTPEESYKEEAGLHAEFSHVICLSIGYESDTGNFNKITFKGPNEVEDILKPFAEAAVHLKMQGMSICGWNTSGFDIPYLLKRYIINGIRCPRILNEYGVKPWEKSNYDLMQDWKCGAYRASSLLTACSALGIPCKSETINGSNLYQIPISEMNWDELGKYCEEDIECTYKVYKVMEKYYFPIDNE